jgi:hypothetical protein
MAYLDKTCRGCSYMEVEGANQCSRMVKEKNETTVLCDGDTSECHTKKCPAKCFLPYPNEYYKNDKIDFYNKNDADKSQILNRLKSNINSTDTQKFITDSTNSDNVKPKYLNTSYSKEDPINFNCSPEGPTGLLEGKKYPITPNSSDFTKFLSDTSYTYEGTNWVKFKDTPLLRKKLEELGMNINNMIDKLAENGVQLEWFDGRYDLRSISDEDNYLKSLLMFENLPNTNETLQQIYNDTTSKILEVAGLPDNIKNYLIISKDKLYDAQIIEWGNQVNIKETITGKKTFKKNPTKIIDIFMITEDDGNDELEKCLNILLETKTYTEKESDIIKRIANYETIDELGKNPMDVQYIEDKIKKFLGVDTSLFVECFLKVSNPNYEQICKTGFSERPVEILANFLSFETHMIDNNTTEASGHKIIIRKILKLIPSVMKKVLDISEKYELAICDKVSKKTEMYKEIYNDLFVESSSLKFELPDIKIFSFFDDFNKNIYTKIVLLIFIAFIISQGVKLFNLSV